MEFGRSGWRRIAMGARGPGREPDAAEAPATPGAAEAAAADRPRAQRIEPGCGLEGRLVVDHPLQVDGEFRGAIECRDTVTIGASGAVEASIRARSVVVHGAVVGDVEASREVVLHATGRLHGNVATPSFVIERGAFFNGQTRMFRPEASARARASHAAPVATLPVAPEPPTA
jgi:cytoskeletal protein CcmA (bactofilin family)